VHAVTFNTIKSLSIRTSCNVTACLEELERLTMATSAHLERAGGIRFRNEVIGVSFRLFGLRGVAAVAAIAGDSAAAVSAGLEYRDDRVVRLLTMTRRTSVLALASNRRGSAKDRHTRKQ